MRFLRFFSLFRSRRVKTIKIRRVLPTRPFLFVKLTIAAALTLLGLLTGAYVLLEMVGGTPVFPEPGTIANPALLATLLSVHAYTVLFALKRTAH